MSTQLSTPAETRDSGTSTNDEVWSDRDEDVDDITIKSAPLTSASVATAATGETTAAAAAADNVCNSWPCSNDTRCVTRHCHSTLSLQFCSLLLLLDAGGGLCDVCLHNQLLLKSLWYVRM